MAARNDPCAEIVVIAPERTRFTTISAHGNGPGWVGGRGPNSGRRRGRDAKVHEDRGDVDIRRDRPGLNRFTTISAHETRPGSPVRGVRPSASGGRSGRHRGRHLEVDEDCGGVEVVGRGVGGETRSPWAARTGASRGAASDDHLDAVRQPEPPSPSGRSPPRRAEPKDPSWRTPFVRQKVSRTCHRQRHRAPAPPRQRGSRARRAAWHVANSTRPLREQSEPRAASRQDQGPCGRRRRPSATAGSLLAAGCCRLRWRR